MPSCRKSEHGQLVVRIHNSEFRDKKRQRSTPDTKLSPQVTSQNSVAPTNVHLVQASPFIIALTIAKKNAQALFNNPQSVAMAKAAINSVDLASAIAPTDKLKFYFNLALFAHRHENVCTLTFCSFFMSSAVVVATNLLPQEIPKQIPSYDLDRALNNACVTSLCLALQESIFQHQTYNLPHDYILSKITQAIEFQALISTTP